MILITCITTLTRFLVSLDFLFLLVSVTRNQIVAQGTLNLVYVCTYIPH